MNKGVKTETKEIYLERSLLCGLCELFSGAEQGLALNLVSDFLGN